MIDREDIGSWMDGPQHHLEEGEWPGRRLGLPETGPGARAPHWRRLVGLCIDWAACSAIALTFTDYASMQFNAAVLVIFFLENLVLVSTLGTTLGHRLVRVRIRRLDGRAPGFLAGLVRTVLTMLLVPAILTDRDQRPFSDVLAKTVMVRR
ncbi:RDD family protein [Brevibacterium litoralis]|uniref:RDD family protein n=1 Tax=Brevibacterium litoralis TaxID=3138935 RepID=UPI0032EC3A16